MRDEWAVSRVTRRFWGAVGTRILESGALDVAMYRSGLPTDSAARLAEYDRRWAYFENDGLYRVLHRAGLCASPVPTEWNPVPMVVGFYIATVLGGHLSIQPRHERADAEALAAAVARVWEWSNFQVLRGRLTQTAAVLGDVFVKVAEKRSGRQSTPVVLGTAAAVTDGASTKAVYLQDISPRSVVWWEADERDFLTGIRIDTPRLTSIFTGLERRHTLVEIWRKAFDDESVDGPSRGGVRFYEVPPGRTVEDMRLSDPIHEQSYAELGYDFIPIVWARVETHWRRLMDEIDLYNAKAWRADRLNRPLWVVRSNTVDAIGRPKPAPRIDAERLQAEYADVGDGAVGVLYMPGLSDLEPAGAPADLAALNARLLELKEGIVDSLPEYRVATLKASTQLATETLQLLLSQAAQRVTEMRRDLERALVRAQMMALTIAQVAELEPGLFAAERIGTYDDGLIDHTFTERGVFEKSAAEKVRELDALVKSGATLEGAARVAGYSDRQALDLVHLAIDDELEK